MTCATCLLPEHHGHAIWNPCCQWQQPTLLRGERPHQNLRKQHEEVQRKSMLEKMETRQNLMKMTTTTTMMKTTRAFCFSFSFSSSSFYHPPFPLLSSPVSPAVSPSIPHHQMLPQLCQDPTDVSHFQLPRRFFFHAGLLLLLTEVQRTCEEGPCNNGV